MLQDYEAAQISRGKLYTTALTASIFRVYAIWVSFECYRSVESFGFHFRYFGGLIGFVFGILSVPSLARSFTAIFSANEPVGRKAARLHLFRAALSSGGGGGRRL